MTFYLLLLMFSFNECQDLDSVDFLEIVSLTL